MRILMCGCAPATPFNEVIQQGPAVMGMVGSDKGTARSRSAINSSSGSRHIAMKTSGHCGQLDAAARRARSLSGDNPARGLGRLIADRLGHRFLKLVDDRHIHLGVGNDCRPTQPDRGTRLLSRV